MSIKTVQCEMCGTTVMASFLSTHLQFVHGEGTGRTTPPDVKNGNLIAKPRMVANPSPAPKGVSSKKLVPIAKASKQKKQKMCVPLQARTSRRTEEQNQALVRAFRRLQEKSAKRLVAPTRWLGSNGGKATCALCGDAVAKGMMLKHKELMHGEVQVVASPAGPVRTSTWVRVFQGGLPSLGKRRR